MNVRRVLGVLSGLVLALVSCGGDDDELGVDADMQDDMQDDVADEFVDEFAEATGASSGGGTLEFDGVGIPIESAVCILDGERIDIGTVGQSYRVLVSGAPTSLDLQILDPEGVQWFDGDPTVAVDDTQVTIDGSMITAAETTWWNNQDDRVVMGSFVIDCP